MGRFVQCGPDDPAPGARSGPGGTADDGGAGQALFADVAGDLLGCGGRDGRRGRSRLGVRAGRSPGEPVDLDAVHAPARAVLRRQMVDRPLPDFGRGTEAGDQDDVASIHVANDADMDAVGLEIGMLVAVGVTRLRMGAMPVLRQGG